MAIKSREKIMCRFQWGAALVTLMALTTPQFALAAQYSCTGKISAMVVDRSGNLMVVNGPGIVNYAYLCNVKEPGNGVDPQTCRQIQGVLMTAQTTGRTITMWYDDAFNCSANNTTHGNWNYLSSWYFGPQLN